MNKWQTRIRPVPTMEKANNPIAPIRRSIWLVDQPTNKTASMKRRRRIIDIPQDFDYSTQARSKIRFSRENKG
jgi:hypothetical protein